MGGPACDLEVTIIVEAAEVPRHEPSTMEDLAGHFGPVTVSGEDVSPTGEDLTFPAKRACPDRSLEHGEESMLIWTPGTGRPTLPSLFPSGGLSVRSGGGLDEAVTDGDPPSQALQLPPRVRVQGRPRLELNTRNLGPSRLRSWRGEACRPQPGQTT